MTTPLRTTSRSDIRHGCGVNTHFCFNPSVYAKGSEPNAETLKSIIDLKIGFIRERWWPRNVAQQKAFVALADAGVGLYLFIGAMDGTAGEAQADAAALAASPVAPGVIAVCGPNEANAHGGTIWPGKVVNIQRAISTEVSKYGSLKSAGVVGPALMHNVPHLDEDYQALAAAGVGRWCDTGDFHYYPGNVGPIGNAKEGVRAGQAYGALSLYQSETGWTGADTDQPTAARFTVETYLRNYLTGMVGTVVYEFADESEYVAGREGLFGLRKPLSDKLAYLAVKKLLATPDGAEPFVGVLAAYARGVDSDTTAVVTSEDGGFWTAYLLRNKQTTATLILPPQFKADMGTLTYGDDGTRRYAISLKETMTTVQVRPSGRSRR
jgi:hypothetical protein